MIRNNSDYDTHLLLRDVIVSSGIVTFFMMFLVMRVTPKKWWTSPPKDTLVRYTDLDDISEIVILTDIMETETPDEYPQEDTDLVVSGNSPYHPHETYVYDILKHTVLYRNVLREMTRSTDSLF